MSWTMNGRALVMATLTLSAGIALVGRTHAGEAGESTDDHDEIEWADMPAARAAAAAFLADATLAPFIAAIEPMSVRLEHYELVGMV